MRSDPASVTKPSRYDRFLLRVAEMHESLKIIRQRREELTAAPGPVMVEDKKLGWSARLSVGADGTSNSLDHIRHIMANRWRR